VSSGALGERGSERLRSAGCSFGSGGERSSSAIGRECGGAGGSVVYEVGSEGGARFGDAPARSAIRGLDRGGDGSATLFQIS
jgi:hypothetical protein